MDKKLTVRHYAKIRGITVHAVLMAIKNGWNMPGVVKVELVGDRYVIFYKETPS